MVPSVTVITLGLDAAACHRASGNAQRRPGAVVRYRVTW
jgi:hypothetical protein